MKSNLKLKTGSAVRLAAAMLLVLGVATGGHAMMMFGRGVKKPAASEFGLGPRTSSAKLYVATLQPEQPLRARKMQSVRVAITDANGSAVDGATITVDGGMPQHGHGLPTRPRVTKALGGGVYEIEGLRFNMGGWWELHLTIDSPAGTDRVTFNLTI
jgi:hypothetical protein